MASRMKSGKPFRLPMTGSSVRTSRRGGAFLQGVRVANNVFLTFRTGYLGKVSPVHLFWGSFDLAVTRFSGRRAPMHPGGIPGLPDEITREAYSHEVSSAGFWPGGGGTDFPAFYSYAYPSPAGFSAAKVLPDGAYYEERLGEFLLPYDVIRGLADPGAGLMSFLESTYRAAADHSDWDTNALECAIGEARRPRPQWRYLRNRLAVTSPRLRLSSSRTWLPTQAGTNGWTRLNAEVDAASYLTARSPSTSRARRARRGVRARVLIDDVPFPR